MKIEFNLLLDGHLISETMTLEENQSESERVELYKKWANDQCLKRYGNAHGFELKLSMIAEEEITVANKGTYQHTECRLTSEHLKDNKREQ